RGRRRGRGGNRPGQQQEGAAPSAPEAQGDEDFDAETSDFSASSEPSFEEMARPQHASGDRDRNRRDENRPRREGRGFESRREGSREQSSGRESGRRAPRGFEPRRDRYGVSDEPSGTGPISGAYDAPPTGEEILVLPGESLARHRSGDEPGEATAPAAAASAPPAPSIASTTPLAPPATLYTLAEGWDGGDVLPGETLRPRGPESRSTESRSFDRGNDRGPRRGRDGRRDDRGGRRDNREDRGNRGRFEDRPASRHDEFAAPAAQPAAPIPEAEAAPVTEPPVEAAAIA